MHGILDCSENMYQVEAWVRASLGRGGHVLNVEIGNGVVDSIARPMDWQLQELAAAIRADPALAEKLLQWRASRDLAEMCQDTWCWQASNPRGYAS